MVMSNAEGKARKVGREKNRQTNGPANDPNGVGAAEATGGGGGSVGGRLPGGDRSTNGKDFGQWVIKNLEYQLAYHSSSVDWYQVEVEKCRSKIAELEAEIVRYEEAKEWHQGYHEEVQADYLELTSVGEEAE